MKADGVARQMMAALSIGFFFLQAKGLRGMQTTKYRYLSCIVMVVLLVLR